MNNKMILCFITVLLLICIPAFAENVPWSVEIQQNTNFNIQKNSNTNIYKSGNKYKVIQSSKNSSTGSNYSYFNNYTNSNINNTSNTNYTTNTNTTNSSKIINSFGKNHDYIKVIPNNQSQELVNVVVSSINDPYVIKINGIKYYMVKNSKTGIYTLNNIIGYGDKKTSLFQSLNKYNTDNDREKLTQNEIKKADIRFVALLNGKLELKNKSKDFDNNKIIYIDMKNTRESINNGNIGSFGYFDCYINDNGVKKKIIGFVTFDTDAELKEMIK